MDGTDNALSMTQLFTMDDVANMKPTLVDVAEALMYEPSTGRLYWNVRASARAPMGALAGKKRKSDGYRIIGFKGKTFYAHHIAFYIRHGRAPVGFLDHANGERDDNRWQNLREADASQSSANQKLRSDNTTGIKGIAYFPGRTKPWRARIRFRNKTEIIGYFATAKEAGRAYDERATLLFGEFRRGTK